MSCRFSTGIRGGGFLWGNPQAAVLYPPNLIALPFSTFAWPLFIACAKVLIALIGMYLLVRELGLAHTAAIFASIAYAFCAFNITYLLFPHTNVTTLLPLLLFWFQRRANGHLCASVWATVTLWVMFTGGHPESLLHCAFVALPWCAVLVTKAAARLRLASELLAIGILALLLAAPLVVPFAAVLENTQRVSDIAAQPGMLGTPALNRDALVPFLVPNYFGNPRVHNYRHAVSYNELCGQFAGLTTLVLALGAVIVNPRLRLGGLLAAALFLLASQPAWLHALISRVPLLNVTAHSRLRFAVAFLMALGAAYGIQHLLDGRGRKIYGGIAAVAFVTVSAVCLLSYPTFAHYGIRRLIFITEVAALLGCMLLAIYALRLRVANPHLLAALLFLDLFSVVGLFNPANGREVFYPEVPAIRAMRTEPGQRILGLDRAFQPNQGVFHRLEDVRTHDPLAYLPYVRVMDRLGYVRSSYFGQFAALPPRHALDFLGVQSVIAGPGTSLPLPLHYNQKDAAVYGNPTAFPRFFVPARVEASRNPLESFLATPDAQVVAYARRGSGWQGRHHRRTLRSERRDSEDSF